MFTCLTIYLCIYIYRWMLIFIYYNHNIYIYIYITFLFIYSVFHLFICLDTNCSYVHVAPIVVLICAPVYVTIYSYYDTPTYTYSFTRIDVCRWPFRARAGVNIITEGEYGDSALTGTGRWIDGTFWGGPVAQIGAASFLWFSPKGTSPLPAFHSVHSLWVCAIVF